MGCDSGEDQVVFRWREEIIFKSEKCKDQKAIYEVMYGVSRSGDGLQD